MGNTTTSHVREAIEGDAEILELYAQLAEKNGLTLPEAVEDFAKLIAIRIDYARKGDMWLIERWIEGINHIELSDMNAHMKLLMNKYSVSYQYMYSITNRLVQEVKVNIDSPFAQIWAAVKPTVRTIAVTLLGVRFGLPGAFLVTNLIDWFGGGTKRIAS